MWITGRRRRDTGAELHCLGGGWAVQGGSYRWMIAGRDLDPLVAGVVHGLDRITISH